MELEKYRDKFFSKNVDEYIGFYTREFYPLDNFSAFKVIYNGIEYMTSEHAYQANKFLLTAPNIAEKIIKSNSPHDAVMIVRANLDKVRQDWPEVKVKIMEEILRCKLEQNPVVKRKLLRTGNYLICEDSMEDYFWGIGGDKTGQNILGKLWMKLRDELMQENKIQGKP